MAFHVVGANVLQTSATLADLGDGLTLGDRAFSADRFTEYVLVQAFEQIQRFDACVMSTPNVIERATRDKAR